MLLTANR